MEQDEGLSQKPTEGMRLKKAGGVGENQRQETSRCDLDRTKKSINLEISFCLLFYLIVSMLIEQT